MGPRSVTHHALTTTRDLARPRDLCAAGSSQLASKLTNWLCFFAGDLGADRNRLIPAVMELYPDDSLLFADPLPFLLFFYADMTGGESVPGNGP